MKSTLIIGSSVCDVQIYVQHYPQLSGDENIIRQEMTMGGCAWNVATVFRQLQLPYTLFSPIGQGIYGQFVKTHFQENDIPILLETSKPNGCCYCIIDSNGERTFLCEHGAEYFYYKEWFEKLNMSMYQSIYICGLEIEEDVDQNIFHFLKQYPSHTLYFAPGPRLLEIPKQAMQNILSLHPILHMNKQEILSYTKQPELDKACMTLYHTTRRPIIVTLGKEGCYFYDGNQSKQIPAIEVTVVNTNGAGDTHIGAIMAYKNNGHDWDSVLQKANVIASQKISKKHL